MTPNTETRMEGQDREPLRRVAEAELPTRFGTFRVVAFTRDPDGKEHLALIRGDVSGRDDVPVRLHSECLTGDALGSLRCDCRDQLIASLQAISGMRRGVLLYLRQEGRGIGLTNKIRAYALQDQGHDTIEANRLLGFGDDERDYEVAAQMLEALGVRSAKLMTNNPAKLRGLREHGVPVTDRIPVVARPNPFNVAYLETKQRHAGHWLGLAEANGTNGHNGNGHAANGHATNGHNGNGHVPPPTSWYAGRRGPQAQGA